MDNKSNNDGGVLKTIIIIAIAVMLAVLTFGGGDKHDVVHDPNGFLGYSDDFWEWYSKNN